MSVTSFKRRGGTEEHGAGSLSRPPTEERHELEETVASSLRAMLSLLSPAITTDLHDEAMIKLGASADMFVEPLGKHEVQVLACALYMERQESPLGYSDILKLTDRFSGKAMNITMVYKSIERLIDRGFLCQSEVVDKGGNRSRTYTIHGTGREAFRLAVMNSQLLAEASSHAAA
ncbi:hypothetical protein [Rhizobium leguminosarum]|uniref:hypothetical protein n=1 Tax=Rhizobium leguminosarum TaxID=384 RepID=UPI003F9D2224